MSVLLTQPKIQFFDNNGDPLAGGKVYTYTAGTVTPKASYTDNTESTENANPVILDSAGRADIWINGAYKIVITDSADATISTTDNVNSFSTLAEAVNPYFESFSGTGSQTAYTASDDLGTDSEALMVYVNSDAHDYITNGTFTTDTDWTKGAGWTIGSGVATASGAISTALSQTVNFLIVEGYEYTLTYTVTRSAGGIIPSLGGGVNGTERTASGTYKEVLVAGSTQIIAFTGNSFTGTLDSIDLQVSNPKGFEIQNPNTYTISGTALTFSSAPASGTNNIYVYAPSLLLGAASSAAASAASSASAAAASANSINISVGTSTTSLAIGTGSKVFTTQEDLSLTAGKWVLATSDADPSNYMHGQVTSYSGTTLTLNVTNVGGTGTLADWTLTVSGTRGATGSGLTNVVDDTTPQLGGDLDANSNRITGLAMVLGSASAETGSNVTTTTIMNYDDTIPQNTEGAEALTLAYTPVSATSRLFIFAGCPISTSTASNAAMLGLFVDSTADALKATTNNTPAIGNVADVHLMHTEISGSTSARTYKLRFGLSVAGTAAANGQSGGRRLGGVSNTYINIIEIEV